MGQRAEPRALGYGTLCANQHVSADMVRMYAGGASRRRRKWERDRCHMTASDRVQLLLPGGIAPRPESNGVKNRLAADDRPVHSWYRFVLSFPSHLVRDYLTRFGIGRHQTVLDPFCGTGTTLVECKKLGISSVGVEALPMAHLAAQVKTDWRPEPAGLRVNSRQVADAARRALEDAKTGQRVADEAGARLMDLPEESRKLLIKGSISPVPLHKTLTLLDAIGRHSKPGYQRHYLLALAKVLPTEVGNLHFGPEVGVGVRKPDAPVVDTWLGAVDEMARDLSTVRHGVDTPAVVHLADSRSALAMVAPRSVDAVVTSPPYPNEKDYTRITRLESVVLGLIGTKIELRGVKHGLVRSNTRGVYKLDDDDQFIAGVAEIDEIADEIERRRIELGKTSGFERQYARVTRLYFGGMARHLAELRAVLRPGAMLAYVVGDQASYLRVMIRTGQILGRIAESLGYETVGIDLFRTRLATATKAQLREEIVVLRWPG